MYFWNIKALKQDIMAGKMGNGQSFPYFFVLTLLATAAIELVGYLPSETKNIWDHLSLVGTLVISAVILLWLYRLNGGKAGQHFYDKYFSIGFVTTIRYIFLSIPLIVIYAVFLMQTDLDNEATTVYDMVFTLVWTLGINLYMVYHFRDVTGSEKVSA